MIAEQPDNTSPEGGNGGGGSSTNPAAGTAGETPEERRRREQAAIDAEREDQRRRREELEGLYRGLPGSVQRVDTGRLQSVYDAAMAMGETGGYTQERIDSIMDQVNQLKEFGKTGGLDQEAINRFRGNGIYDEYIQTGGLNDETRRLIRQTSLAPVSGYSSTTADELNRRRALQGGYAPGFDAAARTLRRDTAKLLGVTGRETEVKIQDMVDKGRQWGATNMTAAEDKLQTLRTGNMFKGMEGAGKMEMELQNSINTYKIQGLTLAEAAARSIADVEGANADRQGLADWRSAEGLAGLYDTDVQSTDNDADNLAAEIAAALNDESGEDEGGTNWWQIAAGLAGGALGGWLNGRNNDDDDDDDDDDPEDPNPPGGGGGGTPVAPGTPPATVTVPGTGGSGNPEGGGGGTAQPRPTVPGETEADKNFRIEAAKRERQRQEQAKDPGWKKFLRWINPFDNKPSGGGGVGGIRMPTGGSVG